MPEIAEELSMASVDFGDCDVVEFSVASVLALAKQMGLPEREDPEVYVPSPETIRIECAIIRASWTQAEREARLGGGIFCRIEEATGGHNDAGGSAPHDRRS